MGPLLRTYMESIYYAMSRSCDRWNIPPTFSFPGTTGDINDIIRQYGIITIEGYAINLADLYHVNMEGTLGALHHLWTGISDPKFTVKRRMI